MKRGLLAMFGLLAGASAPAPRLYADLSTSRVEITYGYAGADLLVYGAVQYPGGRAPGETPKIAIVARGPDQSIVVRRKERVAGIWVNAASERFRTAPAFVAISTSAPFDELLDERAAAVWELGLTYLQFSPSLDQPEQSAAFRTGLIDLRRRAGLYSETEGGVTVTEDILYRGRLVIPSAAPVGDYAVTVLLIRDGAVAASVTRRLVVQKTGFEARVSQFAETRGLLYGLLTVTIAVGAGWAASLAARRQ